jgi:hypothetical protein
MKELDKKPQNSIDINIWKQTESSKKRLGEFLDKRNNLEKQLLDLQQKILITIKEITG